MYRKGRKALLILLIAWCLFWEAIYFYHTLIFVKFHLYPVRDPSLWKHIFSDKTTIRSWLCWEGLLLWTILLPLGMGFLLYGLWQNEGGVVKVLFSALLLVGGPTSLHWADAKLPQFFQGFGTIAAKRWSLEGLPMRYMRGLSRVLFRRNPQEAEQTSLLFYLAYFTDQEQETMFFGAQRKPLHKRHKTKKKP
jgi:hypothetical protein